MPRNCADFERALEDFSEDHAEKKRETQIEKGKRKKKERKKKEKKKREREMDVGMGFEPAAGEKIAHFKKCVFSGFYALLGRMDSEIGLRLSRSFCC